MSKPVGRRREVLADIAGAAIAGALSLAVAALALNLWRWHPTVPLSYSSDALYYQEIVKGTLDHGWFLHNPDVGAPFGLDSHDFPIVSNDSLQLLIVKAMGLFSKQPFLVANAFYLLTYVLNAVGAFVALRWRRVSRELAVFGGAIYGILPLHFMKGPDHLFFSSYYLVPLGVALVLAVLAGEPLFHRRSNHTRGPLSWLTGRSIGVVVLCAAIASASIYYAIFTMILLASASLVRGVAHRRLRPALDGVLSVAAIGAFVLLNQIPTILYRFRNGPNLITASRSPAEGELYGLRLMQLVLPVPGHRLGPLADFTDRYRDTTAFLGEPSTAIGLLATVGLLWLLFVGLRSMVSGVASGTESEERNAAFALLAALLWASAGAFSTLFNYTVTPQFRAWSRMSVVIGFIAIVGVVGLLQRLRRRLGGSGRTVMIAVLAALFVLAALDQTSPRLVPDHRTIEAAYHADADFVRLLEARMPDDAAILQLPYEAYPESPPSNQLDFYDEFRPYLHSTELRWSYGAMKGRPEDWHATLTNGPLGALLAGASASGFQGLLVDRLGYADRGAELEAQLLAVVGPPTVVQSTGRRAFWDLAPLWERLQASGQDAAQLSEVTLRPVRLEFGQGFYAQESHEGTPLRWMQDRVAVDLENPDDAPRRVVFAGLVRTGVPGDSVTTLHFPDGTTETVSAAGAGTEVRRTITVPPGRSVVDIQNAGQPVPADGRRLVVQLVDPSVVAAEACTAADALGGPGCLDRTRAHRP